MPGTRTAPAATTAPSFASVTLHLVDASGDLFTETIETPDIAAGAGVQSFANAYQAATNASLYKITSTGVWDGDIDPQNAVATFRASVSDGINVLWRDPGTTFSRSQRLVAPIASVMQGNQDIPLLSAAEFTALIAAYAAFYPSLSVDSAQFTGRRERKNNPRIRV